MSTYKILTAGDTGLVVEFGKSINRSVSSVALYLEQSLSRLEIEGLIEIVPTFRSVLVQFDPLVLSVDKLLARIDQILQSQHDPNSSQKHWTLPVCYDAEFGIDLLALSGQLGLSPKHIAQMHSSRLYYVYMLGFLPGQPYLGDTVAELTIKRLEKPRWRVPAGVVGIAGGMTSIFPLETPCGWHIVGRCPVPMWQSAPVAAPQLHPGDRVTFIPVSLREFKILQSDIAAGTFRLQSQPFNE